MRAFCRDKGLPVPKGAIARELRDEYLAERSHQIPLPGHPDRAEAYAALPVLTRSYTVWVGPIQVTYGPCPRCRRPTSSASGQPLQLCGYCAGGGLPSRTPGDPGEGP